MGRTPDDTSQGSAHCTRSLMAIILARSWDTAAGHEPRQRAEASWSGLAVASCFPAREGLASAAGLGLGEARSRDLLSRSLLGVPWRAPQPRIQVRLISTWAGVLEIRGEGACWLSEGWMNECGEQWARSREAPKLLCDATPYRHWLAARAILGDLGSRIGSHLGASGVDASERLQECGPSSGLVSWRGGFKGISWAVESCGGRLFEEGQASFS
jgi:hypothetical protein